MAVKKCIAIIGEGETEWFYFDSLRIACRYPFKVAPDFPQHSDIIKINYINKRKSLKYDNRPKRKMQQGILPY